MKDEDKAEGKVTETKRFLIFYISTSLSPSVSIIVAYDKCQIWMFELGMYDEVLQPNT
jgi:hypothetical protein